MMCFDPLELPEKNRSLNGDFFTPNFNYFQLQLLHCKNEKNTSKIMNTPEQKALDIALAEIAAMEKDSEALKNGK